MSLNPDIRDRAYQFFIEEAQELLQVLETGLLDLRQDHSTAKVHELMRAAHSIKGGAASVELDAIGLLAHRLEDFFKALYSDEVDFDGELESLLLQGYDCLSDPLLAQIETGTFDEEAALLKAEPVFAALEERLSEALENADNYIPSSNDLGVDIVSSIFEVDVVKALEHLRTVGNNPNDYDPAAELENTLEMFAGFAELFNLPGFSGIVQTAQTALSANPQAALAVLEATVSDCTQATEQVLAGDRQQGGTVSPLLTQLAQGQGESSPDTAIDEANLWSNASLADDFGSTDSTLDWGGDNLEQGIWSTKPLAEDVFGENIFGEDVSGEDVFGENISGENISGENVAEDVDRDLTETDAKVDWSNASLADDFGSTDSTLDWGENNLEQEIWSTKPLAEDVFGEDVAEDIDRDLTETDAKVDEISQIFDSLSSQTIEDNLATDVNLDPETTADNSDIWSSFSEQPTQVETEAASEPYLDEMSQIFGSIENETETEDADSASVEITDAVDSLWSMVDDSTALKDINQFDFPVESQSQSTAAEQSNEVIDWGEIPADTNIWSVANAEAESVVEDILSIVEPPTEEVSATKQSAEDEPSTFSTEDNSANITAAVESVTNIFESLTTAGADSLLPPAKNPSPTRTASKPVAKSPTKAAAKLSVRVDLDRLERMNNLVGELTINRNSLALQNEQLQSKVLGLEQKFSRFRGVTKQLQEVSDRMLIEARSRHSFASNPLEVATNDNNAIADFDDLELDSYNQLYSALQVILEEMVQLEESVEDITIFAGQSDRTINSQRQMLGQMRDELMWVRMLPLDRVLQRFPRTLRDLSSKYHKPVDLKLHGTGVLVDKAVLEKLADPLLHLLRNGFDHGIETPEIRNQQGKPPTGSIEIKAYYQGNQTVIEVKDDGKGLDRQRITQKAIEQGLITASEASNATPEQLFELIFEPGFSTASQVSEISGRGVGMNIVRSQVETLKGKIGVTSTPGMGSTFTLRLPLTLTIAKLLVCSLGATAFAIPSDSIEEIIIPQPEQLKVANEQNFLSLNGRLIPIYSLQKLLTYNCPVPDYDSNSNAFKTITPPDDWAAPLLLLRRGQQLFALEVVSLLSEQELVIKPYGKAISLRRSIVMAVRS